MKKFDLYLILFTLTVFFCYEYYLTPETLSIIKDMGVLFGGLVGIGILVNYSLSFIFRQGKKLFKKNI